MKQNILIKFITLSVIVASAFITAEAENFQTIVNNGSPQNRVDIAILGDGYTAAQMAQYANDAQTLMQAFFAQEPYKEYQRYYNVHRIDVISNQSGADHPDRNPQVFVDTALDAAYNCNGIQRLICVDNEKVNQIVARTLTAGHFDQVLVLVNDQEYGGSGGAIAVSSIAPTADEIAIHEVGHSFALLADEYGGGGPTCDPNNEPAEVNATRATTLAAIKWNYWIAAGTPIPTVTQTPATPGLYVGSKYCDQGLYRPTFRSKMNVLGNPFEQINTEQHVKRVHNFVTPIDASLPAAAAVNITTAQSQNFSVTPLMPLTHNLTVNWLVDGQATGNGATFTLNGSTLTPGNHTVRVNVADPTAFVRNDPQQVLTATRTWNITIQAAPATIRTKFDFDGDGRADVSVYRPDNGVWYLQQSQNGFTGLQFGVSTDKLAPADYDNDGKTDAAVYRSGTWFLQRSTAGFTGISFGAATDVPFPADFDGDGRADLAVYRPSNGGWYIYNLATNQSTAMQFGATEDIPVPADYDGDGRADVAVFRPSTGTWYLQRSQLGFTGISFGIANDKPVAADYDGDGRADVAVFRPSNGTWYLQRSQLGFTGIQFGLGTDLPVPADYDGDNKADVAVFRAGTWYLNRSTQGFTGVSFGSNTDRPIANSFIP